jgi:integrase
MNRSRRTEILPIGWTNSGGPKLLSGLPVGFNSVPINNDRRLADVTPHTLRHAYASIAGDLGSSELTIAAFLGHSAGRARSAIFILTKHSRNFGGFSI